MNGYNPNYFNRQTVDSMKSALTQVFNEQFPGSGEGQPGLGIGQISDLELQKRMRNKKNTSIFNKNPKQSKEYLELEAEYNRRQGANAPKQTQTAPKPTATAPVATPRPSATTPAPSGGGKSLFAPDVQKTAPTPTPTPTPVSSPAPVTREMSPINTGKTYQQRFGQNVADTVPGVLVGKQMKQFADAEKTAYGQNVSRQGAYSPKDTASAKRGLEADIAAGFRSVTSDSTAPVRYAGAPIPNQNKIPASTYTPQPASPQELQAARNAAPAPAGWLQNYEMRAKAAKARAGKPRI